jgi:hypothetical protein
LLAWVQSVRIYAGMAICQINYNTVTPGHPCYGHYHGAREVQASRLTDAITPDMSGRSERL